ncbi:MAG: serine hydrolase domain-containing protein [Pseudomonadales bacterium]
MTISLIDSAMQRYIDDDILSCVSSMVLKGTEIVHQSYLGFSDLETRSPIQPDSIFRIASNTKIVTSVALMMLYEQGRFGLDDPVAKFLPEFSDMMVLNKGAQSGQDCLPAKNPILIRHLLSHSAGLSYGFIEPESVIDQCYNAASLGGLSAQDSNLESFVRSVAELPLAFEPGSGWRYSVATDVCARLIEVLSDLPADVFMKKMLLDPLGMKDTDFFVPEAKRDRLLSLYAPRDFFDPMASGLNKYEGTSADEALNHPPTFISGGGGLYSTLPDYAEFIRMIVNGGHWQGHQYLQPETIKLMRTNQLADGIGVNFPFWEMPGTVFGLGFAIKAEPAEGESALALGEYHWGGLMGTHSWMAPAAELTGLCFTQRMPGFWHPFSHEFQQIVYAEAEKGF